MMMTMNNPTVTKNVSKNFLEMYQSNFFNFMGMVKEIAIYDNLRDTVFKMLCFQIWKSP